MTHRLPRGFIAYAINPYTFQVAHKRFILAVIFVLSVDIHSHTCDLVVSLWLCACMVSVIPACLSAAECVMHTWKWNKYILILRVLISRRRYTALHSDGDLCANVECILTLRTVIKLCSAIHGDNAIHIFVIFIISLLLWFWVILFCFRNFQSCISFCFVHFSARSTERLAPNYIYE